MIAPTFIAEITRIGIHRNEERARNPGFLEEEMSRHSVVVGVAKLNRAGV